jgi:hypothetical protein
MEPLMHPAHHRMNSRRSGLEDQARDARDLESGAPISID